MTSVEERVMMAAEVLPEGTVVTARDLLHLGTRAAVDQALSRLARGGRLMRVRRGRYVRPIATRFGERAPAAEAVVESLAALTGETVVPGGAAAASLLGLTTQVPVRTVYLTSGRSRRLQVGRQVVELRHAPTWQLRAPRREAGRVVRALAWLGPAHAGEAARALRSRLPEADRRELLSARGSLPEWMARTLSETFAEG